MEDGTDATQIGAAIGSAMTIFGDSPSFGAQGPLGSGGQVTLGSTTDLYGRVPVTSNTTAWTIESCVTIPATPAASSVIMRWFTGGTISEWRFSYFTSGPTVGVEGWNTSGVQVISGFTTPFSGNLGYDKPLLVDVTARQNGGNIEYEFSVSSVQANGLVAGSGAVGGSIAGTLGAPTSVNVPGGFDHSNWTYGHISVWDKTLDAFWGSLAFPHTNAFVGYNGQTAAFFIEAGAEAAGITQTLINRPDTGGNAGADTALMGPEQVVTPVQNMRAAEAADLGILTDGLAPGIAYLCGPDRFNWPVGMTLDAGDNAQVKLPFLPVEDDQRRKDKVTVSRLKGASATAGSGTYIDEVTLNAYDDSTLAGMANFRKNLGTVPEMRVPSSRIDLRDNPELMQSWLGMDIGFRYLTQNLPDQYPPGDLDQVLEGYVEVIDAVTWTVDLVGSPYRPWDAFTIEDSRLGRIEADGSSLHQNYSAGATSLLVDSTGPLWATGAVNFDVRIRGWQIHVTNISGSSSPQTFTVTAIPGDLGGGNPVTLWRPGVIPL
jgi:hypothetical protein